jgi:RNA polymerase sigma-70 factor (ECF subfamily)
MPSGRNGFLSGARFSLPSEGLHGDPWTPTQSGRCLGGRARNLFSSLWKIASFKGGSSFYTWIYRIAVNLAIDAQRRQKRNPLDFRETMDGVLEAQEETARDPFADVHDRELRENLIRAINELTPEHKAVIVLRTIEGLSYKDIGDILGCSEGTVMSRLHYARKKLQEKLSAFL